VSYGFSVSECASCRSALQPAPSPLPSPLPHYRRFLSIFSGLYLLSTTTVSSPVSFTGPGDVQRIRPIALLPWRLQLANSVLAVLPASNNPTLSTEADNLIDFISSHYGAADFSTLGGVGEMSAWGVS
jgi:hypothetical protein